MSLDQSFSSILRTETPRMIRVVRLVERNGRSQVRTVNTKSPLTPIVLKADVHPASDPQLHLGADHYTRKYFRLARWDEHWLPIYQRMN